MEYGAYSYPPPIDVRVYVRQVNVSAVNVFVKFDSLYTAQMPIVIIQYFHLIKDT